MTDEIRTAAEAAEAAAIPCVHEVHCDGDKTALNAVPPAFAEAGRAQEPGQMGL
jgi:hypothetical protein